MKPKLYNPVTVGVHKCGAPLSHHHHGQSVHRLNIPSKESQWSQQWPYSDIVIIYYLMPNSSKVSQQAISVLQNTPDVSGYIS